MGREQRAGRGDPDREGPPGSERLDALVRLSAVLARGGEEDWRRAMGEAASVADRRDIEEVLLQSYLFVGFPVVLNALIAWREEVGTGDVRIHDPSRRRRARDGEALCRRVYGKAYDRLRENIGRLHPDLDRWMIEEGYGKTLSRPGLDPAERELCIVALLAAGEHERQLRSHLRGAANVGASADQIERALSIGLACRQLGSRREADGGATCSSI